jgi:hypothetical protein
MRGAMTYGQKEGTVDEVEPVKAVDGKLSVLVHYWDPTSSSYVIGRQAGASTGGGAGSTVVDVASLPPVKLAPVAAAVRSSFNSSAEGVLLAANANRQGAILQNHSTASALLVGLTTAVVSSNAYSFQIPLNGYAVIGGASIPLYTGAIRGRLMSTALAGPVQITELS